jgi:hypothetical protein
MNTVIAACFVVRLVVRPGEVLMKSNFFCASAPCPLPFAIALGTTGPVVKIVLPIIWKSQLQGNSDCTILRLTLCVVSQTLDFSWRLKHNRLHAHAAASLEILLPSSLD